MEERNFKVFRDILDWLYLQHYQAFLGSRLYAIFKEGEKLVLKPAKYANIGDNAYALDADDFSFLKNLSDGHKRQLMSGILGCPYSMSDLSYEDYIKTYGASIENGKPFFKDKTWGLYVSPSYANLTDGKFNYGNHHSFKAAARKFDYISFSNMANIPYAYTNDVMYIMVDSAMGVVIGGNAELKEETYWHKYEQWKVEHWWLNFFTTSIQYGLTELFEDFCKKNYKKDESGQFYVIPFRDVEKWDVSIRGVYYKLPIHKTCYYLKYDERIDHGLPNPTLLLVDKEGHKQRL